MNTVARVRRRSETEACFQLAWLLVAYAAAASLAFAQTSAPAPRERSAAGASSSTQKAQEERTRYRINLKLDFDARQYTGTERVRWVNRDSRPASVLYFHLYANHRGQTDTERDTIADASTGAARAADSPSNDEPRIEVTQVRAVQTGAPPLVFSLDEQQETLRVQLREAVAPDAATEIEITFKGRVPEVDADETSLSAHVMQQVGAALRDTREWRRARDTNFSSRGTMLLGSAYPVLAVRNGDDWQRKVETSVGDLFYTEIADYEVTIEAPPEIAVYTSGEPRGTGAGNTASAGGAGNAGNAGGAGVVTTGGVTAREFSGEKLRNFVIVAGRSLRSAERSVSGVRVRSIYMAEHETTGRRVLGIAAEAVRIFVMRFGVSPYQSISVTEAPLVAGLGSMEFAGMSVVASAFYVDFDSPATRNLPEIVREQRASVEDSLEFTVAHVVAHQWWGASVGNDPERAPVLDEALAHWSALLYYQETHGAEHAEQMQNDQLRGVYQIYRTFGGDDMAADHNARDYRNSFQYAAIVAGKGALMFAALRKQMGEERFWAALRHYYEANRFEIAEMDDLEAAFVAEMPIAERRATTRLFNRWLSEKRGDEDIAPPNPQLAAALGLSVEQNNPKDRNRFSRLGRFFWRQMTRIR